MSAHTRLFSTLLLAVLLAACGAATTTSELRPFPRSSVANPQDPWSEPLELFGARRYTFAPALAVAEDGQMIAAWTTATTPQRRRLEGALLPVRGSARRAPGLREAPVSEVVVDQGRLPEGFGSPVVLSDDAPYGGATLHVAVSSSGVDYVAFPVSESRVSQEGWRIVALRGGHASRPVRLPQGGREPSTLVALVSPHSGPVTAVWTNFATSDEGTLDYAHLNANGTPANVVTLARIRQNDCLASFTTNDEGQIGAAWRDCGIGVHSPSRAMVVRCNASEVCSKPASLSDGKSSPGEIALALNEDGRLSIVLACAPYEEECGLNDTSLPAGGRLGAVSLISSERAYQLAIVADGNSEATLAFQSGGFEDLLGIEQREDRSLDRTPRPSNPGAKLAELKTFRPLRPGISLRPSARFSLRQDDASGSGRATALAATRGSEPPALVANRRGQMLMAWEHERSGDYNLPRETPITAVTAQDGRLGLEHRIPGTAEAQGSPPVLGIDSEGDAVVLWDTSCPLSVLEGTCGIYASLLPAAKAEGAQ